MHSTLKGEEKVMAAVRNGIWVFVLCLVVATGAQFLTDIFPPFTTPREKIDAAFNFSLGALCMWIVMKSQ